MEKLLEFLDNAWESLVDFLLWLPIKIFSLFMNAVATVIESIEPPSFVVENSLGDYIDPDIGWLLVQSGVNVALAIMASAIVFRFLRRVLTLGIW